jgi:acyl transferase domain-containing protein/NAD(P)H-dependent flavin oxidoreductase YrpB (nitropropane dioxygenase family)
MEAVIALTPNHCVDPRIAIAATRAGELGILDLGSGDDREVFAGALGKLQSLASPKGAWGVRWDTLALEERSLDRLAQLLPSKIPVLLVAGINRTQLPEARARAQRLARRVFFEVYDLETACLAQAAGFDGLVVKGHEAGGRIGPSSSYILLQEFRERLQIPYWIQGGIGPRSAAAATMAGASGVALAEQLWLTEEGPWFSEGRKPPEFDGSETIVVGRDADLVRLSNRHGRGKLREVELAVARGDDWRALLARHLADRKDPLIEVGQDIALAGPLARRYATTGQIIAALRAGVGERVSEALAANVLAPEAALARVHGARFPIVQGPMTRVSDVAPFAKAVADAGALPFLALAVMPGKQVADLLTKTKQLMGDRPWGVGMLGFIPLDLRQAQMQAIREVRPPYAIIAGGRPSQAREMEALGVSTYLHVPSPGLLRGFINEGARKFIFEGSECGGHTGPRTSFILWEQAIEVLSTIEAADPQSFQILFAGGVHDALSAAIVSVLAAPLAARGMNIGVLMGTAYLFTEEAVRAGAVVRDFQAQAIDCQKTALLQSGVGIYTRCAKTPFCDEFDDARRNLMLDAKSDSEILMALELLNIGRLRIASKGLIRNETPASSDGGDRYVAVDPATQRRDGLYMMGEVARLRNAPTDMATLHNAVSAGCADILVKAAAKHRRKATPAPREEIAIVGMACLMPNANDLRSYWQNILRKVDTIREVPPERWRSEDYFEPTRGTRDKVYSRWGGFLEDIAFDPTSFGIPPASLPSIEPVQLLALYVARKALEDAGFDQRPFPRERTATIFAAGAMNELGTIYVFRTFLAKYLPKAEGISEETRKRIMASLCDHELPEWTSDSFPGFLGNVIAGRVANRLDLHGVNFTVDAACASGLAALEVGVRQLRDKDADVALVGAVDAANGAVGFMSFAQTQALSPRGRSRPFDDSADGIALGEGVAAVVLKRLADAERDGDKIYSVIKGIGASSDGRNRSLTAPSPEGQVLAIERAYADAGVDPASVALIEAHGTGTALGDRSEIESLIMAFGAANAARQSCGVGSVKSMIGHTKVAAGLAALIKASLALKHRVLPPTIGVERPNTRVAFERSPFYVNTELRPWLNRREGSPRRCGVSAFGFGGTNFHTVLEEYKGDYRETDSRDLNPRAAEIFAICRSSAGEVEAAAKALLQSISRSERLNLAQLAFSAHLDEMKVRPKNGGQISQLALVATSVDDLKAKLELFLHERRNSQSSFKSPQGVYYRNQQHREDSGAVCMLFPGQGSQQVNMLRDLVASHPSSFALFERADAILGDLLPQPLSRYIYPPPAFSKAEHERQQSELNDTRVAQSALGVADLAAFDILAEFGLRPNFLAGHSYGEYVALCVAGVISRDDLIRLSHARGRVAAEACGATRATMAAVNANEARVLETIARLSLDVSVANLNAPDQTIIAGAVESIGAAVKAFERESVRVTRLAVTAAFHSAAMAGARDGLAAELAKVDFKSPRTPVFSNTTCGLFPSEPEEIKNLLVRHIVEPLRFVDEIQQIYAAGARVFIECGPGLVLSRLVDGILGDRPHAALGLDASGRPGSLQLAHLLAQCAALGLPLDLEPWFRQRGLKPVSVDEALEIAQAEANPGPMVWRLNGWRAKPWAAPSVPKKTTPPQATPTTSAFEPETRGSEARASIKASELGASAAVGRSDPSVFSKVERRPKVQTDDLSPKAAPPPLGNEALFSQSRLTDVQGSLSSLIDLQRRQQEILWRFMEFQESLLSNGQERVTAYPRSSAPAPEPVVAAPLAPSSVAENARGSVAIAVPPTPVLPKFVTSTNPIRAEFAASAIPSAGQATPNRVPEKAINGSVAASGVLAPVGLPPTLQFSGDLIRTVAERTGYTEEMLDRDAHMEADLGIDSIKRIEILSQLKEQYPFMEGRDQEVVFEELANLKTLNEIIGWYDSLQKGQGDVGGSDVTKKALTPLLSMPETVESFAIQANERDARRYALIPLFAPLRADREISPLPSDGVVLVIGRSSALGGAYRSALQAKQLPAIEIAPGAETKMVDSDRYEVDFSSFESVSEIRSLLAGSGRKAAGILNIAGEAASEDEQFGSARRLFLLLKALEGDLRDARSAGGWLVNLTRFDGQFGLRRARAFPVLAAGTLGVTKTAALEWPELRVKCIDADPELDQDVLVDRTLREIASDDPALEVGFTCDGRFRLDLKQDNAATQDLSALQLSQDAVLLVTGGAYGVTADVTKAFAEKFRPRIVLTGRSPLPEKESEATCRLVEPHELKQYLIRDMRARDSKTKPADVERALKQILKNREIAANIAVMRAAGAQVEYHALDVRDGEAFARLIESVYSRWGRIDGVLHGAGVIDDKLIRDKSLQSFDNVFATKVTPAKILAERLRPEGLKFLLFFSSIAGRFGNAGQCDYSAANEVMNKFAERLCVAWPHVRTVAINWGPWDGGMVNPELRKFFAARDIFPIAIEQGKRRCLEELERGGSGQAEIVVAASLEQIAHLASRQKSAPAASKAVEALAPTN